MNGASLGHLAGSRTFLIIEPQHLLRHTVALTARNLRLAEIYEAGSYALARELLKSTSYSGVLIADDEEGDGLDLADAIRRGETACRRDVPLGLMMPFCTAESMERIRELGIRDVIVQPLRARTVLRTICSLLGVTEDGSPQTDAVTARSSAAAPAPAQRSRPSAAAGD